MLGAKLKLEATPLIIMGGGKPRLAGPRLLIGKLKLPAACMPPNIFLNDDEEQKYAIGEGKSKKRPSPLPRSFYYLSAEVLLFYFS